MRKWWMRPRFPLIEVNGLPVLSMSALGLVVYVFVLLAFSAFVVVEVVR